MPIIHEKFIHTLYQGLIDDPDKAFKSALSVLQEKIRGTAGGFAQLRNTRNGKMIPLAVNDVPQQALQEYTDYFCNIDPWQHLFVRDQVRLGVNVSDDIISRQGFHATEFYQDYWHKHGFGDAISVFGRAGECHAFTFGVTRWKQDEDFSQQDKLILEPLRSHLQNAVALTLEVQLQKRKAQIHNPLIEHLPVAIFLVDQSMHLLDHNLKGGELLKAASMFTDQHGILSYHHTATQELLLAKLKNYSRNDDRQNEVDPDAISGQSQRKGLPMHNIYLLPVLDNHLLCFQIVVTVADDSVADPKTASLLASLFGLTDAEAQVAVSLFNGFKPVEIAAARGASVATVRAQLKSIMAKAHCHSQLELVRRISQLIIPFR